ncbi:MAG TPA: S-adenosylmethionine:tRNA ribosyltransferase-isomerase [Draconibacterium sp.]|nr:S-adenosylmethionine:tRNA ribosyltransferase-isomerase [Draconibacterium sp.]
MNLNTILNNSAKNESSFLPSVEGVGGGSLKISNFTYDLSESKIAKYPLPERDQSKLLVWKNGIIEESVFKNCVDFLPENAQLIFNNTRVIHARMFFRKETGSKIEIFCLEPVEPRDYQIAFQETEQVVWKCLVGNSKKWKSGILSREIEILGEKIKLQAEKTAQFENTFHIKFSWDKPFTFAEIIEHTGILPIPPYLNRETEDTDEETYQTVYAKIDGSVAAPTAGLHFTDSVLNELHAKNISTKEITLHVGAGTFQPVKSETIDGHTMHREVVIISKNIIEGFVQNPDKIIAVGTTSVRSLESLYWLGLQMENNSFNSNNPEVLQWEPYENEATISIKKAFQNIVDFLNKTEQETVQFSTQIIIFPGYDFKVISGMFTNFHQPQSTLLLLIAAFLGNDWKKVYDYALNHDFRFLSYGDSNLYLR